MLRPRHRLKDGSPRAAGLAALCAGLLLLLSVLPAEAEPISVFVSIPPQKYFVEQIAGAHAKAAVMVAPGDSPETYEPKPRQLAQLAAARIYFEIGVPFERAWMARLRAANPAMTVVDTASVIARRDDDPHIWTNPAFVKAMASHMRDAFVRLDPQHAEDYERNYGRFAGDLDALDADIRAQLSPYRGRAFVVFHAAWGYFADAYELRQITLQPEGKEAGPRALAQAVSEAKALGCRVVFVQPQFSRRSAEMVAQEIGGRVDVLDPLAEDYVQNMRRMAAAIAASMARP